MKTNFIGGHFKKRQLANNASYLTSQATNQKA